MDTSASSPPPLHLAFGPHHAFPMSMSPALRSPFAPHSPDSPQPQHRSHPPFDAHTLFSSRRRQSQAVPQLIPHPTGWGRPCGGPGAPTTRDPGQVRLWCEVKSAQSCSTLCDPVDCSPPGSSVHEILQARVLEWVAISFSRRSSRPRD